MIKKENITHIQQTGQQTLDAIAKMDKANEWIWEKIAHHTGQRIMETGCGNGNFTPFFIDREYILCIDIDKKHIETMHNKYNDNTNLELMLLELPDEKLYELKNRNIDTIICLNVLEHIKDDQLVLDMFYEILVSGGKLILLVPNFPSLFCDLDSKLGHFRRYTQKEVREKMQKTGFIIKEKTFINMFGILGWVFNGKILRKKQLNNGLLELYNTLVPIFNFTQRLLYYPTGLSIITIGEKP